MTVRYRSTGKPAFDEGEPEVKPQPIAAKQARAEAMKEIEAREARQRTSGEDAHEAAVKSFDFAYRDVVSNPALLNEVLIERHARIEKAGRNRETIDWGVAYPEIGEAIREKAGLPNGPERERREVLDSIRKARGKE